MSAPTPLTVTGRRRLGNVLCSRPRGRLRRASGFWLTGGKITGIPIATAHSIFRNAIERIFRINVELWKVLNGTCIHYWFL